MKNLRGIDGSIRHLIYEVRGHRVMLDLDLAALYKVSTGQLNQAVKRNIRRFPADFMFEVSSKERQELITICDNPDRLRFNPSNPKVFTEQGVAMLSGVLRSPRAVEVNVAIMRAFVRLRALVGTQQELARRLSELEKKVEGQGQSIHQVFEAIREMMVVEDEPKPKIGFRSPGDEGTRSKKRQT